MCLQSSHMFVTALLADVCKCGVPPHAHATAWSCLCTHLDRNTHKLEDVSARCAASSCATHKKQQTTMTHTMTPTHTAASTMLTTHPAPHADGFADGSRPPCCLASACCKLRLRGCNC